jgi:hypothetical protein
MDSVIQGHPIPEIHWIDYMPDVQCSRSTAINAMPLDMTQALSDTTIYMCGPDWQLRATIGPAMTRPSQAFLGV